MNFNLLLAALCLGSSCSAQLFRDTSIKPITGDPAVGLQVMDRVFVSKTIGVDNVIYRVSNTLELSADEGAFLQPSQAVAYFTSEQSIDASSVVHEYFTVVPLPRYQLLAYNWEVQFPGNYLSASANREPLPNLREVYIGFRRLYQGGWQYGWVHMQREVTRAEDMIGPGGGTRNYAFRPAGFAIHPVPDRPIRAGMEPDLPSLATELVTLEGGVGQGIRVSWPADWPGMVLEFASELAHSTEWQPVAGVEGSQALVELPEEGQVFFRLRYAP